MPHKVDRDQRQLALNRQPHYHRLEVRLAIIANPTPSQSKFTPHQTERRRQIRGLLLLALIIFTFSLLRAGVHNIFHTGWWRLW